MVWHIVTVNTDAILFIVTLFLEGTNQVKLIVINRDRNYLGSFLWNWNYQLWLLFILEKLNLTTQLLRSWVSAWVQVLVSLYVSDWAVVIRVFGAFRFVGSGIIRGVKVNFSFLRFDYVWSIIFVKIVNLILILTLLIILRIWNNVNLLRLLLVLRVGLALNNNLIRHVGAILLWNNILTWVQYYHLLKLTLVELVSLVLNYIVMHLLRRIHFFGDLHLWESNNLIPWNTVVLLDLLHRHGVSVSILAGLVGLTWLNLVILLFE